MTLVLHGTPSLHAPCIPIRPDDPANPAVAIFDSEARLVLVTRGYRNVYEAGSAMLHAFPHRHLTLAIAMDEVDLSAGL